MLMNAVVVKCDVTSDIVWDDIPNFTQYVRNNLTNYQKYICKRERNGKIMGLILQITAVGICLLLMFFLFMKMK